ncbi:MULTISPECIES: nucleotidyl transferase AbiEii/AbiGii toxin family protein [Massilia]|uniref:Nucleotidyl transferase AbiEii/AbiGii toxin family protein n=1 Tax=Massilia haematophila TaxID=457923 RepID=A0ABV7PQS7_9BURK|nr:nucleotidyl transferase AbiEii/AbiGii toxin family protein [Massilia sp.]
MTYIVKAERPLDPNILAILATLQAVATDLGFSYFLVGATARDVLMTHVFGLEVQRATHDVDFAVALEDWPSFDALKRKLLDTGDFESADGRNHLLRYKPWEFNNAYPLDLIPFGGVEHKSKEIAWPPDMDVVMNVTGYAEALKSALQVDVGNKLVVPVISIPGLAVLKLLAWNDRGLDNNKDAKDLFFLLSCYADAGNAERLYGEAFSTLEACGFDPSLAGARLLGHDARLILEASSRRAILDVLDDTAKRERLIAHMLPDRLASPEKAAQLIEQFEQGINSPDL